MLEKTLAVQYEGDKAAADNFIVQYTTWDEELPVPSPPTYELNNVIDSGCLSTQP